MLIDKYKGSQLHTKIKDRLMDGDDKWISGQMNKLIYASKTD